MFMCINVTNVYFSSKCEAMSQTSVANWHYIECNILYKGLQFIVRLSVGKENLNDKIVAKCQIK